MLGASRPGSWDKRIPPPAPSAQEFGIRHQSNPAAKRGSSPWQRGARGAAPGGAAGQDQACRALRKRVGEARLPTGSGEQSHACLSGRAAAAPGLRVQGMEPSGISLPKTAAGSQPDPFPPRWEVGERVPVGRSKTRQMHMGGHWRGASMNQGQRETAQTASSNLLIAALLKYFRSVTLTRLLQARQRAPAGSLGCGYKCSLLLPAQGNYGESAVPVLRE